MPPYRVKLTPAYEQSRASWKGEVEVAAIRSLNEKVLDILEHKFPFQRMRPVSEGHVLSIDVDQYTFLLFVTYRDETFYLHEAVYNVT